MQLWVPLVLFLYSWLLVCNLFICICQRAVTIVVYVHVLVAHAAVGARLTSRALVHAAAGQVAK